MVSLARLDCTRRPARIVVKPLAQLGLYLNSTGVAIPGLVPAKGLPYGDGLKELVKDGSKRKRGKSSLDPKKAW